MENEPVLCYVDGEEKFAYFTTQDLDDQWGDDWNDIPYEHNAGLPYLPNKNDIDKGKKWEIVKVAFDGDLETPSEYYGLNSPFSVEHINGNIAWLSKRYGEPKVNIHAGVTIDEFRILVKLAGGKIYTEEK